MDHITALTWVLILCLSVMMLIPDPWPRHFGLGVRNTPLARIKTRLFLTATVLAIILIILLKFMIPAGPLLGHPGNR